MKQVPDSLLAFQHMFPDDDACAAWLMEMRWPDGFVCPACGHEKGWALRRKAHTFECAGCRRQTSVTAGTILHASKLPLTVWFWAAYLMATHSNGISALQLQKQLGIGSYRSAWLLAHKLRASMVDPERNPLSGLVEIDEASLPFRTKDDPPTGGQGRSHDGKMLIVGAIELGDGNIQGRLRLAEISSYGAADLGHFVETAADPDAIAKTDGWSGYAAVPADRHNVHVVGKTAAHLVLPWIHQVFSNLKGWARGVYHGLRRKHLQAYLDEFVFRFNRRKTRHAAFRSLFRLASPCGSSGPTVGLQPPGRRWRGLCRARRLGTPRIVVTGLRRQAAASAIVPLRLQEDVDAGRLQAGLSLSRPRKKRRERYRGHGR